MSVTDEIFDARPDYEGKSPQQRAMRRFLDIMAHFAGKRLTGTVIFADRRHDLFLNYEEMRGLSKCPDLPEDGFGLLSTEEGNLRAMISGAKNRAAITRDFSGLCWRGEHQTDADGTIVWGIEWTLNGFNGAAWAGARHLDREVTSANGHEIELREIERHAPQAGKRLFGKLREGTGRRLDRLLTAREEHGRLLASPLGDGGQLPSGE